MPIGSNFDDFLKEEGIYDQSTAAAMKKVLALQIEEGMREQQLTKTAMAKRMHTSRAALNRLLDDRDTSLTLTTLASAAAALGRGVRIELVAGWPGGSFDLSTLTLRPTRNSPKSVSSISSKFIKKPAGKRSAGYCFWPFPDRVR